MTNTVPGADLSYPRRLAALTDADPDRPAVTCGPTTLSRAELQARAHGLALRLADRGVGVGDMVTIALPNSVDWVVGLVAIWKLGAVPQPVSPLLPEVEMEAILELAQPAAILGAAPGSWPSVDMALARPADGPEHRELPDAISPAWKAPTSGGSTGRPKLIVSGEAAVFRPRRRPPWRLRADGCLVVPGPLYHSGPLVFSAEALLWGVHVVLLPRFEAEATLADVEAHRADVLYLVPTMMRRIWRLGPEVRSRHDLSSLRAVWHMAEPCPAWLKQAWIDWLGPDRIMELYSGSEGQALTIIRGSEWLTHRGSVGRPVLGEVSIRDAEGRAVPNGVHGEVWLRSTTGAPTYRYVGAEARSADDGWESLGDMGYVDDEGYLYLGDRATDMILVGGVNVYPAEVEAAILGHPAVRSCAVIGLPDDDKGNRVHAIVEAAETDVSEEELLAFLATRLVRYKLPRSVELVSEPLRDEAGKVRRSELRRQRLGG